MREIGIPIPVRKMFIMSITHIDNIGIPKHEKHLRLHSSGTKLFITFELKGFSTKRVAQSFYDNLFIRPKRRAAPAARPRRASKVNRLLPRQKLNSLTFFKSPKSSAHASGAWRHSHVLVTIPIWDFYFDICEWHILPTHANTCAHVAPN